MRVVSYTLSTTLIKKYETCHDIHPLTTRLFNSYTAPCNTNMAIVYLINLTIYKSLYLPACSLLFFVNCRSLRAKAEIILFNYTTVPKRWLPSSSMQCSYVTIHNAISSFRQLPDPNLSNTSLSSGHSTQPSSWTRCEPWHVGLMIHLAIQTAPVSQTLMRQQG